MEIPLCIYPFSLYVTRVLRPFNPRCYSRPISPSTQLKRLAVGDSGLRDSSHGRNYMEKLQLAVHTSDYSRGPNNVELVYDFQRSLRDCIARCSARTSAVIIARTVSDLDNKFALWLRARARRKRKGAISRWCARIGNGTTSFNLASRCAESYSRFLLERDWNYFISNE